MVLTKAGERLLPYANEVMASVDRLRFLKAILHPVRALFIWAWLKHSCVFAFLTL